ncbi:hypothetical protein HYFRA_00009199 [Hymenoscyphus fraxineus]|uniref:Fungal lipase-type domain-containing protein n=1 Tax=Hymenoscyphus fraxineus TaxID=746836 RepID=A0A9N9PSE6_9HELO|nr:hypothetical protein HYFRA_00009199 [Hymenoscyphus fraxineus]
MSIFGRSKKERSTTSRHRHNPLYNSQFNLNDEYLSSVQHSPSEQRPPPPSYTYATSISNNDRVIPQYDPYQPVQITQKLHRAPPMPERTRKSGNAISRLNLSSMANLLKTDVPECIPGARILNQGIPVGTQYLNQGAALCDVLTDRFNNIITLIDGENWSGDDRELIVQEQPLPVFQQDRPSATRDISRNGKSKGIVNNPISSAITTTYFAKVNMYANSRLPPNLRPMKLYMPTFPLLCTAARYSERVYMKPVSQERETHVNADWRQGTKAMVIKSVPMDDMNTIVFAIRGTQTFMDWAVNLNSAPASPQGFLDDVGNLCHAGFLTVARKMIAPVAARLRFLLQENPSRAKYSLLITGHSAGGAVAALLYSHMLSTSPETESELNVLTGYFKRVHCVSFGAPPISLLPLTKPSNPSLKKSLFMSFINEGDPVTRADKAYVRSLMELYAKPAPSQPYPTPQAPRPSKSWKPSSSSTSVTKHKHSVKRSHSLPVTTMPLWPVPDAPLSNAGRIVLLRGVERCATAPKRKTRLEEKLDEGVVAQIVDDDLLRGVIWGDPVCHTMRLYAKRIEVLATNAVMGME